MIIDDDLTNLGFTTPNYMNDIIEKQSKHFLEEKEKLIKLKFTEKGFGHVIEGVEKRRFPKICIVQSGKWEMYYADNDTDEGLFILAIEKDISFVDALSKKDNTFTFNFELRWTDKVNSLTAQ